MIARVDRRDVAALLEARLTRHHLLARDLGARGRRAEQRERENLGDRSARAAAHRAYSSGWRTH
jgi:hypothetical protein